jgi:hypothetical protein
VTFIDLAADCGLGSKEVARRYALKLCYRLRKAPFADLEPEEVELIRAAYQSEINRKRHEAGLPPPEGKGSEGMTIKQIAELCEAGETTVRRWIDQASANMADLSAKTAEARETSKPARFTLPEVLAIIRAGGKGTMADLLADNAAKKGPKAAKATAVPKISAALIRECRLAAKDRVLSSFDIHYLLGIPEIRVEVKSSEPAKAPLAIAEAAFEKIGELFEGAPA